MGVILLLGGMLALFLPALLVTLVADLSVWKSLLLVALAMLVGGYFFVANNDAAQALYWRWTLPAFPPDETEFVTVAGKLRALRAEAATSGGDAAALHQTEARLCALPAAAENWVGKVEQTYLISTGEGASLTLGIWPHLAVRTALVPDRTDTVIHAGSPVFSHVTDLQQGDVVRFSGRIMGHAGACPDDPPTEPDEKLRDPEFLIRFTAVAKEAQH
jgi:hypothetical protein